jgi:ATP-dependent RNA helicase DDX52/ROK1
LQRCLFSATIGPFVRELAESFLHNPVEVAVGVENAGASTIEQKLVFVGREDGKILGIRQLVQQGLRPPVSFAEKFTKRIFISGLFFVHISVVNLVSLW